MHETQEIYVCINPECPASVPQWRTTGEPSSHQCYRCDEPMRKVKTDLDTVRMAYLAYLT